MSRFTPVAGAPLALLAIAGWVAGSSEVAGVDDDSTPTSDEVEHALSIIGNNSERSVELHGCTLTFRVIHSRSCDLLGKIARSETKIDLGTVDEIYTRNFDGNRLLFFRADPTGGSSSPLETERVYFDCWGEPSVQSPTGLVGFLMNHEAAVAGVALLQLYHAQVCTGEQT